MHFNCVLEHDNDEQVLKDSCQARICVAALKAASISQQQQLSLVTICNRLRLDDAASVWVNGVDSMRNFYDTSLRAGALLALRLKHN